MHIRIASIMLIASVLGLGALAPLMATQTSIAQQEDLIKAIAGGFESISVVQDASTITITITKTGGEDGGPTIPPGENVTIPEGPIIIVPPNNETGQNGTVIVPEPPANVTDGNVTLPVEPPVIIVDPDGNATTVTPPSNVTVIDNDTVVVAPPDQPVTETPGNVTIVDPPPANVTEPAPCECPGGVSGGAPDIQFPPPTDNATTEQPVPGTPDGEPMPEPELPDGQQNVTDEPQNGG